MGGIPQTAEPCITPSNGSQPQDSCCVTQGGASCYRFLVTVAGKGSVRTWQVEMQEDAEILSAAESTACSEQLLQGWLWGHVHVHGGLNC